MIFHRAAKLHVKAVGKILGFTQPLESKYLDLTCSNDNFVFLLTPSIMHTEVEKETIVSFCWGHPLLGLHLSEICVGDNDNAYAHSRRALLFYYFWQWHVFSCKPRQTLRRKKKIFF